MDELRNTAAGVDLGGSLTKIAYHAGPTLQFAVFPSADLDATIRFLHEQGLSRLVLTGGGSVKQRAAFDGFAVETADEFEASICGANWLLSQQGGVVLPYALATIGTGTSISKVDRDGGHRFTGTGVGGGTLIGLGRVLTGETTFAGIVERATQGDRSGVDLLIRDIYGVEVAGMAADITASNFAKLSSLAPNDLNRAMFQMVGEVIAVIASLAAASMGAAEIVYVGASLRENALLQEILESVTRFMGQKPRFVQHSEHAGALGALMLGNGNPS